MKKRAISLIALVLALSMFVLAGCGSQTATSEASGTPAASEAEPKEEIQKMLTFASGPSGGGWYVIGAVLSDLWMNHIDGMNITLNEGGSVANLPLVDAGTDAQIGLTYTTDFLAAANGTGTFEGEAHENMKVLCTLYPSWWAVSVMGDSDIQSIYDLAGKSVSPTTAGSGAEVAFLNILKAAGLSLDDMKVSYGSYGDCATMMQDGILDAFCSGGSYTIPGLLQVDAVSPVRVLELDDEILKNIEEMDLGYDCNAVIPAGTYSGITEDVNTISSYAVVFVNGDINDETAYALTSAIWENLDEICEAEPTRGGMLSLEKINAGVPQEYFHAGALRYLEEKGVEW